MVLHIHEEKILARGNTNHSENSFRTRTGEYDGINEGQ